METHIRKEIYLVLVDMGIELTGIRLSTLEHCRRRFLNTTLSDIVEHDGQMFNIKLHIEERLEVTLDDLELTDTLDTIYNNALKQIA